jgi:hypothetical protein
MRGGLMPFEMVSHCTVCGNKLTPYDMRRFDQCDQCVIAGEEFAQDLGPEHETETVEAES